MVGKLAQFQPRNLLASSAYFISFWTHAYDATKSLKFRPREEFVYHHCADGTT